MNDMNGLEKLNERYGPTNMTAFRLVTSVTEMDTVSSHIETDLAILNSCDVDCKEVSRIMVRECCIDICTMDNGTQISYFFTNGARFCPKSIAEDIEKLCRKYDVMFEECR